MPEQRRCTGCGTNYESVDELHQGGWCPHCGSTRHEPAVQSDYRAKEKREADPPEPDGSPDEFDRPRLPGSTEDYLGE